MFEAFPFASSFVPNRPLAAGAAVLFVSSRRGSVLSCTARQAKCASDQADDGDAVEEDDDEEEEVLEERRPAF